MPILSNPRHERFAQELAAGKTADEAYELAGNKRNRGNASRLKANECIVKRVAELQERAAAVANSTLSISLQWLEEKAEEARQLAMQQGQPSAAVAAIKELGVLSGLRVEKRENTNRNANDLTDDELADIARRGSGDLASAAVGQTKPH
jgi:phage terminase small subunit